MPISPQAGDSVTRPMVLSPQPHAPAGMVRGANQGHPCAQGSGTHTPTVATCSCRRRPWARMPLSPLCVIPSVPRGLHPR
jgi:hypothetical protein